MSLPERHVIIVGRQYMLQYAALVVGDGSVRQPFVNTLCTRLREMAFTYLIKPLTAAHGQEQVRH